MPLSDATTLGLLTTIFVLLFLCVVGILLVLFVRKKRKHKIALEQEKVPIVEKQEPLVVEKKEHPAPVFAAPKVDSSLTKFVSDNLAKGYTKEQLYTALLNKGWKKEDLDAVFVGK